MTDIDLSVSPHFDWPLSRSERRELLRTLDNVEKETIEEQLESGETTVDLLQRQLQQAQEDLALYRQQAEADIASYEEDLQMSQEELFKQQEQNAILSNELLQRDFDFNMGTDSSGVDFYGRRDTISNLSKDTCSSTLFKDTGNEDVRNRFNTVNHERIEAMRDHDPADTDENVATSANSDDEAAETTNDTGNGNDSILDRKTTNSCHKDKLLENIDDRKLQRSVPVRKNTQSSASQNRISQKKYRNSVQMSRASVDQSQIQMLEKEEKFLEGQHKNTGSKTTERSDASGADLQDLSQNHGLEIPPEMREILQNLSDSDRDSRTSSRLSNSVSQDSVTSGNDYFSSRIKEEMTSKNEDTDHTPRESDCQSPNKKSRNRKSKKGNPNPNHWKNAGEPAGDSDSRNADSKSSIQISESTDFGQNAPKLTRVQESARFGKLSKLPKVRVVARIMPKERPTDRELIIRECLGDDLGDDDGIGVNTRHGPQHNVSNTRQGSPYLSSQNQHNRPLRSVPSSYNTLSSKKVNNRKSTTSVNSWSGNGHASTNTSPNSSNVNPRPTNISNRRPGDTEMGDTEANMMITQLKKKSDVISSFTLLIVPIGLVIGLLAGAIFGLVYAKLLKPEQVLPVIVRQSVCENYPEIVRGPTPPEDSVVQKDEMQYPSLSLSLQDQMQYLNFILENIGAKQDFAKTGVQNVIENVKDQIEFSATNKTFTRLHFLRALEDLQLKTVQIAKSLDHDLPSIDQICKEIEDDI